VQDAFGNQTYVTPMTRTVADTALMMQAMAGEDASDPWSMGIPATDFIGGALPRGDLSEKKILFCLTPTDRKVSADVAAAFSASLKTLEALGAELEEIRGDAFDVEPIWRAINHTVWRTRFEGLAAKHRDEFSETFLRQLALAQRISGTDYQQAMFDRTVLFRSVQALLQRGDMLAMPTISRTALPIEQDLFGTIEIDDEVFNDVRANWFPWTMPFNMTGHPAVSIPAASVRTDCQSGCSLWGSFAAMRNCCAFVRYLKQRRILSAAGRTRRAADFGDVNSIEC
jgi:aspartyl-tRNA(Asn)/glutamyl-tRNA(Gln) amidotransferase subunit A